MEPPRSSLQDLPRLLTTSEVAELTRLTQKTIRNRVYRGLPPHPIRICGRLRWRLDDVLHWLSGDLLDPAATTDEENLA